MHGAERGLGTTREEAKVETRLGSVADRATARIEAEADRARRDLLVDGIVSGLIGGIALAIPLLIWDWAHTAHRALELPMAATAWIFGLQHFSHEQNFWWPIVLGVVLVGIYSALGGLAFAGLADRVFALESPASSVVGGVVWGLVNFVFFWYILLPIARDGAPFRATLVDPALYVASDWVWILGFTLFGLVTGAVYAALHRPRLVEVERSSIREESAGKLRYAG